GVANAPYVSTGVLDTLRSNALVWWRAREANGGGSTPTSLAGTFDGVTFDEPTAAVALDIANTHTREQMVAGGVYSNGASAIVGNRPYTNLAQVAAVGGVGTATMQGLADYARSLLARGTA